MLQVITGRFHPHLESALVEYIRRAKAADPLAPVAILVPSKPLLDRIRRVLAVDHQLSFLNVHLLTFHQLALRLVDEIRDRSRIVPLRVVDDLFFEQLIRHLVRSRLSGLSALQQIGHSSGTWGALWSTVRDLKDAGVDPAGALRGLDEGCFDKDNTDWLHALFSLQAVVKEVGTTLEVGTADDLAEPLLPFVPASPFLASLSQIFYYGFYDLTQVQLSLFQTVSATAPTTLFFPLENGASFEFAQRFFDRYIQPLVRTNDSLTTLPSNPEDAAPVTLSVQSVIGLEEELCLTCRTILDLVETNGYRFDQIGVVARTLDPYLSALQPIFDRHRIPFTTTAGRTLIQEPLCKALLQLAALPINDFYRTAVLDVVTSPFYAASAISQDYDRSAAYRPEQWKMVVQALQITHGIEEWKRLEKCSLSALELDEESEEAVGSLNIAPDVIALLWQTVSELLATCAALPGRGTIGPLVEALQRLVAQQLRRPEEGDERERDPQSLRLASSWHVIDHTLSSLCELDAIGEALTWAEFVELLTYAFERATAPLQPASHQGVMLLDAMTARGLPFKALFVLGLNEKVFPRYIREDAFLRDRHRRVLETTLGFKIDEKLSGYEEEALLFSLLCQAATSRLYLSFQRADNAGRMLASSPFLTEGAQQWGLEARKVEAIPRRVSDRMAQRPTMGQFLPPADLAQWMAMNGRDPADLLEATGRDANLFRHAVEALDRIEDDQPVLTAFDGLIGPLEMHWSRVVQQGIAPTPLERYARCPFRYFSADVLKLEPIRLPISPEPDARLLGTLCHAALRRCYELLLPAGWPANPVTDDTIDWCIETAVEQAAGECETLQRTGHYLLWELAKAQIVDLITAAVDADTLAQADEPFTPIAFEVDAQGVVAEVPGWPVPLKVRGRIDRVDRHRESGALRIIDYKLKTGTAIKSEDRNLLQAAVRGYRLQPPLYAQLSVPDHGTPAQVQFIFLAPHWPIPVARSMFDATTWSSESGALLRKTLGLLVDGVRNGRFFILPDSYCQTCEYRIACRREHAPTWWRAYRAAESKTLTALRTIRVKDE